MNRTIVDELIHRIPIFSGGETGLNAPAVPNVELMQAFRTGCFLILVAVCGCAKDRLLRHSEADQEVDYTIGQRNGDPRWHAEKYGVGMDSRSRFFEPYDQDSPPMPADDPTSQSYMRVVDGKRGWKHWNDIDLEKMKAERPRIAEILREAPKD